MESRRTTRATVIRAPTIWQNFPVITSSKITGTTKNYQGHTWNSIASSSFTVEFFVNGSCDGSGNGEGKTYLGFAPVTTDGSGQRLVHV